MESYLDKQDVIHKNAKSFNEDCKRFDSALEAFENDVIPQSAWDSIVPSIAEENAVTNTQGFQTIQVTTEEEEHNDTCGSCLSAIWLISTTIYIKLGKN